MASILKVNEITDISGNTMPYMKGAILQTIVHQEDGATSFTASSTSDKLLLASGAADSTSHLSVNITPRSTSSKILLSTNIFFEGSADAHSYLFSFYRNNTKLAAPVASSRRSGIMGTAHGYFNSDISSTADQTHYKYYDSPNTTSEITYAVSFQHSNANAILYLNRTVDDQNSAGYERGISILIAQEIGG